MQRLVTVGELSRYLCARIGSQNRGPCKTSHVFYRLRRELLRTAPLQRQDIRPRRRWESLIPAFRRRRIWRRLRTAGLQLPALRVSSRVLATAAALCLVATGVLVWKLHTWLALVTVIPTAFVAWLLTRALAIHPYPYESIRSSVLYLTSFKPATDSGAPPVPEAYSPKEIADKVRLIIMHNLGATYDEVHDEARFVEDLGAQ